MKKSYKDYIDSIKSNSMEDIYDMHISYELYLLEVSSMDNYRDFIDELWDWVSDYTHCKFEYDTMKDWKLE